MYKPLYYQGSHLSELVILPKYRNQQLEIKTNQGQRTLRVSVPTKTPLPYVVDIIRESFFPLFV